jgi:hypothetical protein
MSLVISDLRIVRHPQNCRARRLAHGQGFLLYLRKTTCVIQRIIFFPHPASDDLKSLICWTVRTRNVLDYENVSTWFGEVQRDVLDMNDSTPGLSPKLKRGWALISSVDTSASDPKSAFRTWDFGPSVPIITLLAMGSPFVNIVVTPASSYRMLARARYSRVTPYIELTDTFEQILVRIHERDIAKIIR